MSKGTRRRSDGTRKPRAGSYREAAFKQGIRTVKETVDVVSFVTGEPRSRVNQFARKLIDDGLLPKSIGKDIRKVGPEAAMLLIFAIGHATRTADVTSTAKQFMQLSSPVLDRELVKLIRNIGIRHEPDVMDALKFFLTVKHQWLLSIGIIKSSGGNPYIELDVGYIEERRTPKEEITRTWFFCNKNVISTASREYKIGRGGVWALRYLMWAPNLPNDPSDFDDFLDGAKAIEDDQAAPKISADYIQGDHADHVQAMLEMLDKFGTDRGGDG